MKRIFLLAFASALSLGLFAQGVRAQAPCCTITAINSQTGIVAAKVNASGAEFDFKLPNVNFLKEVRVGLGVFANFGTRQVSLDGHTVCCSITSGPAAPVSAPAAPAKPAAAPPPATMSPAAGGAAPSGACCVVTAIDAAAGRATGRVNTSGETFTFTASASVLDSLKVGQAIFANFTSKQISVDGKSASGTISAVQTAGTPPAMAPPGASAPAPSSAAASAASSAPTGASKPTLSSATAAMPVRTTPVSIVTPESQALACMSAGAMTGVKPKPISPITAAQKTSGATGELPAGYCTPKLGYGTPEPITDITLPVARRLMLKQPPARWEPRQLTVMVEGKSTSANILHLRGLDGIQQAQGLPEAARDFLILHVKTLPAGESDSYVVNLDLANEWAKTHPAPPSATPTAPKSDGTAGCDKWTWHCAEQAGQHAVDQASQQADELRQQADKDWDAATGDAIKAWDEGPSCFEEQTLSLNNIPVEFQAKPSFGDTLTESGNTSAGGVNFSGTATGKVNLAIPFGGDFKANFAVFYIPCLPFVVRPKSMGAGGDLTIGSTLTASLNATGKFDYQLTIPDPKSGVQAKVPLEIIPIVIFGVPICEMDVSAFFEGGIEVSGTGKLTANFELDNPHEAAFTFSCDGSGCTGTWGNVKEPTTTVENAQLSAEVDVTPDVYTALQLDFDIDAVSVRSGPEPHLYGRLSGCVGGTAEQTFGGGAPATSTSQGWYLLTGDVDWDLKLRTELALIGYPIGNPAINTLYGRHHLWYEDLWPGGSNALDAIIAAPAGVQSGKPATFKVSMPTCYPYTDKVIYKVAWTGGATEANVAPSTDCSTGLNPGLCTAAPAKPFGVDFTWPTGGSDTLTVIPVSDAHGRVFKTAQPTQVNVNVQGPAVSPPVDTTVKP